MNYPDKMMRPKKRSPDETRQAFLELCREIGFGRITVEVADGVPFNVKEAIKSHRLDLTNGEDSTTLQEGGKP